MKQLDRDLRGIVRRALDLDPKLSLERGARHYRVVHADTGDFVPVSTSSSDRRARANLESGLRRLSAYGAGLVAARAHLVPAAPLRASGGEP